MGKDLRKKITALGVAVSLLFLIFAVLLPSASAVNVSAGIPQDTAVNAGTTIIFEEVNLTIRSAEAIPVKYLTFVVFDSTTNHKVAQVRFSLEGIEISETPRSAFSVRNVSDISDLPYQSKGCYYGYDERTGHNVTKFHFGYGYGYGYGNPDLTLSYIITYKTSKPGTYYARLFVKTTKYTYASGETMLFTVKPRSPLSVYIDIKPGDWPNKITLKDHGYLQVAICGTNELNVHTIDPKSLVLSLHNGKNKLKPLCWSYQDVATPYTGSEGGGHGAKGDGILDIVVKFRVEPVIHVLKLFKHPGEVLRLVLSGMLKKNQGGFSLIGHDYIQVANIQKKCN